MPIDFPNSPNINDTYTVGNRTWVYATTGIWNSVVTAATTLDSLSDVQTTSAANGQFLKYSTATSQWINSSLGVNINDLEDVIITSATTTQVLKYNGSNWVNDTDSNNAYSMGGFESGAYYAPAHDSNASAATITQAISWYLPFYVPVTTTFDRIGCRTGSAFSGTATVRLGIYNNSTNRPDTVLLDAGTLSATTSSTFYEITINQQLTPGWYWLVFNSQTNASPNNSFSTLSPVPAWGYQNTATNLNRRITREQTGVTGAFATAGTLNTGSSVSAPSVLLRAV